MGLDGLVDFLTGGGIEFRLLERPTSEERRGIEGVVVGWEEISREEEGFE